MLLHCSSGTFLVRHYGIEPGFEWLLYVENLTKEISTFEKFEVLSIQLDFFLQVLFKDEFNFSVYFGYDWIVHLKPHPIAASLHVLHDLTYLFHTKAPTPWTVGDTMQCCLLQKYGVIFYGKAIKSNFSSLQLFHFLGRISFYGVHVDAINSVESLNLRFLWR